MHRRVSGKLGDGKICVELMQSQLDGTGKGGDSSEPSPDLDIDESKGVRGYTGSEAEAWYSRGN